MTMNIVCQQCKELLQLDSSLTELTPSAHDIITASLPSTSNDATRRLSQVDKLAMLSAPKSVKDAWQRAADKHPRTHSPLPNESFVLLQDSIVNRIPSAEPLKQRGRFTTLKQQVQAPPISPRASEPEPPNPTPLSHHLRSTQRLFNLLSSRSDIDHPLCAECTHVLLSALQRQLDETKKERDGYLAFEKEVKRERERERELGMTHEEAEAKIARLDQEEKLAVERLREAEREKLKLEEELKAMELEEQALEREEAAFWQEHNAHLIEYDQQMEQLASLRATYAADSATLEKLERTNVYNDAFCIGHDNVFGTINGLRLGRVPGIPVEWAEINAAWGQTLLLLHTIARKLDYKFENYKLIPMGSFSRIEKITGDKSSYELYGSGDLHISRLLHNRRFDLAMVAFLDCLKHLIDYVKSQDPTVEFHHQITKDKIGEASVKLQFNQEEAWTRALRHVLLALKILLKWTTNGANG